MTAVEQQALDALKRYGVMLVRQFAGATTQAYRSLAEKGLVHARKMVTGDTLYRLKDAP